MKHSLAVALAAGLALAQVAAAQQPPIPVPVDRDSDGFIDINNLDDLNEMRNDLAGTSLRGSTVGCPASGGCHGYELTRNLDFDLSGDGVPGPGDWNNGAAWVPVGTAAAPFTAQFSGNGHSIANLRLQLIDGVTSYGLFGVVDGGTFVNLRLDRPQAQVSFGDGNYSVGTVAGNFSNSYARFMYVTNGQVHSDSSTHQGGLFGRADRSDIVEAVFTGEVRNSNTQTVTASAGGIAGRTMWSTLANVSAKGSIYGQRAGGLVETATNTGISGSFVNVGIVAKDGAGGLVNTLMYDKSDASLATRAGYYNINASYAMGTMTIDSNRGGGLVSRVLRFDGASGRISDSYARMPIRNQVSNSNWSNLLQTAAAGIVTISNSYWVRDPAGTMLIERHGNVSAPGHTMVDMQCAASPVIGGCAQPLLFSSWGSVWDFGSVQEMPALRLNPVYPWISSDTPNGNGDHETIENLQARFPSKSCPNPWYLTAKQKNSPYLFVASNIGYEELAVFNPKEGLSCKNADQPDGQCLDYRVSYLCDATAAYGTVFWTGWYDVDNPSGTGDNEPLPAGQLCPAGGPIGVMAQVPQVIGRSGPPQKLRTFNATEGLRCVNSDNTCKDYEVQFQCDGVVSDR